MKKAVDQTSSRRSAIHRSTAGSRSAGGSAQVLAGDAVAKTLVFKMVHRRLHVLDFKQDTRI
jgi:hypothetical protein